MKKLFGVIGNPIGHSMSPQMHNDLFRHYGIDAHYHPFLVEKGRLSEAVTGLKALGVSGFNVTVPYKTEIMPLLDFIDPLALEIGAVNTVIHENGQLKGFNTDGPGFLKSIEEEAEVGKGTSILVIGAGGAARAIFFTLAKKGPLSIDICNRTLKNAKSLIEENSSGISSRALSLEEAADCINRYDLVIQTTSIGMHPNTTQLPLELKKLEKGIVAADIIYNPLETAFLEQAKIKGAKTINGIGMFVHQGALAFEMWTGMYPDTERMAQTVQELLGGSKC